jgi:ribonuclease HI
MFLCVVAVGPEGRAWFTAFSKGEISMASLLNRGTGPVARAPAAPTGSQHPLPGQGHASLRAPTGPTGRVRVADTAQVRTLAAVSHRKQPQQHALTPEGTPTAPSPSDVSDDAVAEFEGAVRAASVPLAIPVIMWHRLRSRVAVWSALITSTLVMGWITGGMPLLWSGAAPEGRIMSNHPSALEHSTFVGQAVADLVATSTVMLLDKPPLVVSALGVVPKKGTDKLRLIWDGRYVNDHLVIPGFKYEDLNAVAEWAQPSDYAFTMDLKSGYHHLDMHEDAWQYLGFQWEGQYYCFTQLPFGLAPACWAFTKLTRSVMAGFRQQGVRCTGYIDDSMWLHQQPAALRVIQTDVLLTFEQLGFLVNMVKSRLEIAQHAPYLGMEIDLLLGVMRVPVEKREAIYALLKTALKNHRRFHVRDLAAIKGKLISFHWAVGHAAFFFTKAMDADMCTRHSWASHLSLSRGTINELSFWLNHFEQFDGTWPIWRAPGYDAIVHVDAAGASPTYVGGWGAVLRRQGDMHGHKLTAQGHWHHHLSAAASSTGLELLGVLRALESFLVSGNLAGMSVLVVTDSHNVFTHMTTGRVRAPDSVPTVQDIFLFAFMHKIRMRFEWVPREQNVEADELSKLQGGADEHQLHQSVFQSLSQEFGPFDTDLFASHTNHLLPSYFSRHYTPTCAGVDAFAQLWNGMCFANPPFAILGRVLQYAAASVATLCLICPFWPAAAWWHRVCGTDGCFHSCVHDVRVLPDRADLLMARIGGHGNRCIRPRWPLLALRIDFRQPARHKVRVPITLQRKQSGARR